MNWDNIFLLKKKKIQLYEALHPPTQLLEPIALTSYVKPEQGSHSPS